LAFRRYRAGKSLSRQNRDAVDDRLAEETTHIDKKKLMSREDRRDKTFGLALRILAARPRSENQLRERLMSKTWADEELVEECIARLKELGYINDRSFAENYANHRLQMRPAGRSRIRQELSRKEVARETIDEALDVVFEEKSEESLIDRAIEKRIRLNGRPRTPQESKKLFDHLLRRGFDYGLIIRKLRDLGSTEEE
jgi:regulatory protein